MDPKETQIYTAVIIAAIILGIIIFYFFISIIRQQRKNLALQKQSVQLQIASLEKDRARIASDLHDELGPMLSAVKMKINSIEINDPDDEEEIEKTNMHIDDMLKRMREISFNLMPNTLIRKGLVIAIQEFISYIGRDNTLQINFSAGNNIILSEEKTINMYRIVQEIIHNTIKHAKATKLVIQIENIKDKVVLKTADNGVGFDQRKEEVETSGIGLRNLLSRTEMMKGQLFFESKKGKGTAYTFEIPV